MQPHVPCGAAAGGRGFGSGSSLCCLHSLGVGIRVALLSNPAALVSLDVLTKMGRTCLRSYPTNRCQPLPFEWSHIVGLNFRAVGLPMSLRTCGSCWSSWQCLQDSPGLRTLVELGPKTGTCSSKVNPPFVQGPYFLELFTQPLVSRAPLHVAPLFRVLLSTSLTTGTRGLLRRPPRSLRVPLLFFSEPIGETFIRPHPNIHYAHTQFFDCSEGFFCLANMEESQSESTYVSFVSSKGEFELEAFSFSFWIPHRSSPHYPSPKLTSIRRPYRARMSHSQINPGWVLDDHLPSVLMFSFAQLHAEVRGQPIGSPAACDHLAET